MKKSQNLRFASLAASFLLSAIMVLFVSPAIIRIDSASAATEGVSSNTWLNMISEYEEASVDLKVEDPNGSFATSSEEQLAKFNVATNNYTGYTLAISGHYGSSLNNEESGASITSIDAPISEADFSASAATSYNNKWGVKSSRCINNCNTTSPTYAPLSDGKYLPVLATGTTLDITSTANSTPNEYAVGIGVRAGADRPEGVYTNTFILSATTNPVTYDIIYADNTGDIEVSNLPVPESGVIGELKVPLSTTIPTRKNYTFLNWCLGVAENNATTCNGYSYEAGEDFPLDKTINPVYTLYAIWESDAHTIEESYTINLDGNGATNNYSESTTVKSQATHIDPITTQPTRSYTISGFAKNTTSEGATISSTDSLTSTYVLTGWYSDSDTDNANKIADNANSPLLLPNTPFTDEDSKWNDTSNNVTLYAGWAEGAVTLPTIARNGSTCGWGISDTATSYTYASGQTIHPISDMILYGVCVPNSYHQTVQVKYQNADGTWGDYITHDACTIDKMYGSTHSCTISATAEYQAASLESYTVYDEETKQIDVYRNTNTVSLTKGTGVASVSITGDGVKDGSGTANATVYYNGTVTIAATLSSNYDWVNWTGSATYTNQSQSISDVTSDLSFTANGKASMLSFQNATMADCGQNMYDDRGTAEYKNIIYTTAEIDGLCWMTRNLDLPGGTTLTPADSNVYASYTLPASSTEGFSDSSTAYVYNSNSTTCGDDSPCYSYYSYRAAMAGTDPATSHIMASDICPKGWRLPQEYEGMNSPLDGSGPFYSVYAGDFEDSTYTNSTWGEKWGHYWFSNSAGEDYAQYLSFNESYGDSAMAPSNIGVSVRCVLENRTPFEKLEHQSISMQEIGKLSSSEKANLLSEIYELYNGWASMEYYIADERDGQTYIVKMLDDGRFWMMTNLNLGATTLTNDLTSSNTNLSTTIPASTFNGYRKTSATATTTAAEYIPVLGADQCSGLSSYCDPDYELPYGTLYNYCAASANSICTENNSDNAAYDICPNGWGLPTIGDFQTLYNQEKYNSNEYMRTSYHYERAAFTLAGNFTNGMPENQESFGNYWSNTRSSDSGMYGLNLDTSNVNLSTSIDRGSGSSIRCILK
ncbi:hypothetical protein IKG24_01310 [Candidatus Saccharibacteria bacterium]|nr:hypothetical protein [Candidatus Saccharibacteria bacterium]